MSEPLAQACKLRKKRGVGAKARREHELGAIQFMSQATSRHALTEIFSPSSKSCHVVTFEKSLVRSRYILHRSQI
ncbi:MAG: hypothetical protein ACRD3J_31040, partial [Thermoanaerobaculia bacterium]